MKLRYFFIPVILVFIIAWLKASPQSFRLVPKYDLAATRLPNVLSWNTFLGSSASDFANAVAVDGAGNVYITGVSRAGWGRPVDPFASFIGSDSFVAKLDRGGELLWNTFLAQGKDVVAYDIAVDTEGNVYVAGSDRCGPSCTRVAFLAKLDPGGHRLWSTSYGIAYGRVDAFALALDRDGNCYLTGRREDCSSCQGYYYTFVAKFGNDGRMQWAKLLDHYSSWDLGNDITLDGAGNVFIAGESYHNNSWDAYVTKLEANGSESWIAYLGGTSFVEADHGLSIALDGAGNIYTAGYSAAGWGVPRNPYAEGIDAFVAKLNGDGELVWNTFCGGPDYDAAYDLAVDAHGNIWMAGNSLESWGAPLNPYSGRYDAMLVKLDGAGNRLWNTFFGGEGDDNAVSIALDGGGYMLVAGYSTASWGAPLYPFSGNYDAVVVKMAQRYTVNFTAGAGGAATGDTTQVVNYRGDCMPVTAVPDSYYFFQNWTSSGGFASSQNPLIVTGVAEDMTITAHFRKISPPIQRLCERVQNRSLSQVEYINVLRWSADPGNADLPVGAYRVYEIVNTARVLLAQVSPQTTEYRHRKAGTTPRTYHIVCIVNGTEGEPLVITL